VKPQFPIFERLDKIPKQIAELKAQADNLLEDFLPQNYTNGEVRFVPDPIYRKVRVLTEQISELQAILLKEPVEFGPKKIEWVGPLGTLEIRPAPLEP